MLDHNGINFTSFLLRYKLHKNRGGVQLKHLLGAGGCRGVATTLTYNKPFSYNAKIYIFSIAFDNDEN